VYVREPADGPLVFHPLAAPSANDVADLARRTAERVAKLLEKLGRSLDPEMDKVAIDGHDRERLERICRYLGRPPVAQERLERLSDGRLRFTFTMKKPWRDGTTALLFEPLDRIARLCAMVPPPWFHLALAEAWAAAARLSEASGSYASVPVEVAIDGRSPKRVDLVVNVQGDDQPARRRPKRGRRAQAAGRAAQSGWLPARAAISLAAPSDHDDPIAVAVGDRASAARLPAPRDVAMLAILIVAFQLALNIVVIAFLSKKLVQNFEPNNANNTWKSAWITGVVTAVAGVVPPMLLGGWLVSLSASIVLVVLYVALYRLGIGLAIGITILMSLLILAVGLGAGLVIGFLAAISPAVAIAGIAAIIGVPILLAVRDRNQRKRMEEIYRS
jgi:hypothetical protein